MKVSLHALNLKMKNFDASSPSQYLCYFTGYWSHYGRLTEGPKFGFLAY